VGQVSELVLVRQEPAVGFQRPPVLGEQILDLRLEGLPARLLGQQLSDRHRRRIGDDPPPMPA
jgi:hypothetical protein